MADPVVLQERVGDVLVVTLNRPHRHNAMTAELNHQLGEAIEGAEPAGVRVIVVTGSGEKAFCAGADMLEMSGVETPETPLPPPQERVNGTGRLASTALPVIAAINGYCYGGGARLAIDCDIRLASDNATFRLPGVEYGLVVAAATLPRLVGVSKAKEWIFTARKFDAAEALDAGLLSAVYRQADLLPAALEMAATIAGHSASAVRESKRVMDIATASGPAKAEENSANQQLRGSPEQTERFRSATNKVTGR